MPQLRADASVICLFANGVDELQFTEIQRAVLKAGYKLVTVAPSSGVVQSWHGTSWGHFYPVDRLIGETLGSDFDALIIPGGARAVQKLRDNMHTRRLINHFLEADKPVSMIGEAVGLLALSPKITGRDVSVLEADQNALRAAHVMISTETSTQDDNLLTVLGPEPTEWVSKTLTLFAGTADEQSKIDITPNNADKVAA